MIDESEAPAIERPIARCTECDREVNHYNTFVKPNDERSVICWECLQRMEKGFNADRNFQRTSRRGVIPR